MHDSPLSPSSLTTAPRLPLPTGPVCAMLDAIIARFPDNPAIDFLGRKWTYRELGEQIDRACAGFQSLGVKPGTRVGLCLPNTPYYVICYYGVLKAGGIVVNFNPLYVERELRELVEDSGTTLMVTLDLRQIYPKVAALLGNTALERIVVCSMSAILPSVKSLLFSVLKRSELADVPNDPRHIGFAKLIATKTPPRAVEIDPATAVAVLQYTGGTTGLPKGAMLTHANVTGNLTQILGWFPEARWGEEKMLAVLPFFHVFAMTVAMNVALALGAELILLPRFDLETVLKTIARKKPTLFPGVPTIYSAIIGAVAKTPYDLSSLRFCLSGGAPLPIEVKTRFEELTGCTLIEGYGLSEASPVVCCNPLDGAIKPGSIGQPLPGTTVEIRSALDPALIVPRGERGEICVRGPQVMAGYWRRPQDTEDIFIDGALRTGDIGYIDDEGYVFLVDRIKDVILCGGYNVYPRIIEEALYQHEAVAEAVVIGLPDDYRGEAPKAFVRLRDGYSATPEDLKAYLATQISRIEMPKTIELRDDLPRTMVGKLSKKALVDEERAKASTAGDKAS
ncbi:dicarboxylate--CoA ligase PimA [Rhodospirillum rubrum]|uniref:long-chain-fatty-acid--CoA ligase n=1 Tax=Rhodospirillum rubrum TaxID=1085 RepID=UPI001907789E|nr:long-chain fatty acid--CoA ligase [Rhodospirillum rubrum]MBK1662998.1 dicarboxylate--CoA ligase PimA [Rhodospirillum rubrum]MBK1676011.1 dicarboxylate--CoA ligase PimA [Rhodospirillum rubrum]